LGITGGTSTDSQAMPLAPSMTRTFSQKGDIA
jgi:hypothetical protein